MVPIVLWGLLVLHVGLVVISADVIEVIVWTDADVIVVGLASVLNGTCTSSSSLCTTVTSDDCFKLDLGVLDIFEEVRLGWIYLDNSLNDLAVLAEEVSLARGKVESYVH